MKRSVASDNPREAFGVRRDSGAFGPWSRLPVLPLIQSGTIVPHSKRFANEPEEGGYVVVAFEP